jgi:hypothetical protein
METLRVPIDDMLSTASTWYGLTAELAAVAPSGAGLSCQASAAAVNAVHAGTSAAGETFAARTQITAVKTAAASVAYASTEANSAEILDAITESV